MAAILVFDLLKEDTVSDSQNLICDLELEAINRIQGGLETTVIQVDKTTKKVITVTVIRDGQDDVRVQYL